MRARSGRGKRAPRIWEMVPVGASQLWHEDSPNTPEGGVAGPWSSSRAIDDQLVHPDTDHVIRVRGRSFEVHELSSAVLEFGERSTWSPLPRRGHTAGGTRQPARARASMDTRSLAR